MAHLKNILFYVNFIEKIETKKKTGIVVVVIRAFKGVLY